MTEVYKKVQELREIIIKDKKFQFRNCVEISGWVLKEPTYGKVKDQEVCYLILTHIHPTAPYQSYMCSTMNRELIEKIKKEKYVFAISCIAHLLITKKQQLILGIVDAKLSYSITGMDFVRKENENDTKGDIERT